MTDKELEDELFKAIQNGEGELVPIDQVGGNPSDYYINEEELASTLYSLYYDSCHSPNPFDTKWTTEKYCSIDQLRSNRFACYGNWGHFRWYSMSIYFDSSIHKLDSEKIAYNSQHKQAVCGGGDGPCENLSQAINEVDELIYMLNNPLLVSTSKIEEVNDLRLIYLEGHLGQFLETGRSVSVFTKNNNSYIADTSIVSGKDVIIPFIYATNSSLRLYGELAYAAIKAGANTVIGIFATRIMPTIDGRECKSIPSEYEVHQFAPRLFFEFLK